MSASTNVGSSKLGTMPIGKLILTMSGPAILSMLVQALYNIVDSIFIGNFDPINGVTALSYAMPMQLLVNAFAIGLGVGTGSLISRLLGEGKTKDASLTAQTGLMMALITSAIFLIIGYFISDAFIAAYTIKSSNAIGSENMQTVYEMGSTYLTICVCCSIGFMIETMLNRILQSMGNMVVPMITQIVGAVTNIVLDPILISVCGLGAPGAAIATVIGQFVAMAIPITIIIKNRKKSEIDIFFTKSFRVKGHIVGAILKVGLPTIIMNSIGSIMYMASNYILNKFEDAVWAFGVYFKLQSFAFMPVFGLNQGCIPIMGYNYGANNKKRFVKTFRICIIMALVYMSFALILFHAMPEQLLALFSVEGNLNRIKVGSEALRICSVAFIPASFSVIMIAMFNSVGHGVKAMLTSILRQIGVLLPVGFLLTSFTSLGSKGYWTAFPIAEVVSLIVFLPIALVTIKNIFAKKSLALANNGDDAIDNIVEDCNECDIDYSNENPQHESGIDTLIALDNSQETGLSTDDTDTPFDEVNAM